MDLQRTMNKLKRIAKELRIPQFNDSSNWQKNKFLN